jgi:hypothetical protein
MRMPVLGGKELYQLSVKKYPELRDRFLFMSGDFTAFCKDAYIPEKRRLQKPFKIKELLEQVHSLVLSQSPPSSSSKRE